MKAAVLYQFGEIPRYEDFPDPVPGEGEVLINVKAVALENVDKMMAEGTHFASRQFLSTLPAIVGFDGIGELPDGRLVGFGGVKGPYGAMAEKTVVPKEYTVPIPTSVDAVTAAALPASALTSLFPLKWGARLEAGETVFINGATGVAGKLAVQIAKLLGAGRIVATGRNEASLKQIAALGADTVIDLKQADEQLVEQFRREAGKGFDVILDFLWGRVTELLIRSLVPQGLSFAQGRTRLVQIGEKAGSTISLLADALRTTGLEIMGAGAGLTPEAIPAGAAQVWDWIRAGKLRMDIEQVALQDVADVWERDDFHGKRVVIVV
ncbi:quinone oxidoreductase family protein [Alicyclobacillus fodiniaquatilis]|uniref:Zinc-binding alcohol dehydrogenase family protein n=1 Tax=Alicyclobacillus fodiniaquatilis TaxID=1661150 RepID=A0ABW4JLD5_9BACL